MHTGDQCHVLMKNVDAPKITESYFVYGINTYFFSYQSFTFTNSTSSIRIYIFESVQIHLTSSFTFILLLHSSVPRKSTFIFVAGCFPSLVVTREISAVIN